MEHRCYFNQKNPHIKSAENFLNKQFQDIDVQSYQWYFTEETGLALVLAEKSRMLYLSFASGAKTHALSYNKINQIVVLTYTFDEEIVFKSYFYRLKRKFQKKNHRLSLLSSNQEGEIYNIIQNLLEERLHAPSTRPLLQVAFEVHEDRVRERFLDIAQEYHLSNLKYTPVFPVFDYQKKLTGNLIEEETFIYLGELEKEFLPAFLGAMAEEGMPLDKVRFYPMEKL